MHEGLCLFVKEEEAMLPAVHPEIITEVLFPP